MRSFKDFEGVQFFDGEVHKTNAVEADASPEIQSARISEQFSPSVTGVSSFGGANSSSADLLWDGIKPSLHPGEANAIEQLIGFKNIQRNVDLSRELSALQDMLDEFRAQNNERAVSSHERMAQEISFLDTPARRFVLDQARTVLRELRPWWIAQHRDPKEFLELKADPVFIPMYVFFF